jgi:uncharacterized protein YkwD
MTNTHRTFWPVIGILLLFLPLAACGPALNSPKQIAATLTKTTTHTTPSTINTPAPTTAIQIILQGHPTTPPTPLPTTPSTKPPISTPTKSSNGGPTSQEQQLAQYVFGLINHDRVTRGLPSYTWNAALARGARLHNSRMVAYGQLSHQCPGEPDLGTRITSDGLAWRAAGENIGWSNYPDPQQGLLSNHQAMMAEQPPNDGHRRNILSTSYTLVGIDVLIDSQRGVWLTEDFAQL